MNSGILLCEPSAMYIPGDLRKIIRKDREMIEIKVDYSVT